MSATANGVDPALVTRIVDRVKSQGIFDQFRRDCLADVDTKPAYQNLGTRVEGYVSSFLANFVWTAEMNKNQLRNSLRRQINGSEMLASGVERIIEQVVDAQIQQIFLPRIETVVKEYLHSDNAASSSIGDVKLGMEGASTIPPQYGSSGSGSSPMVGGVRGSPADSPLVGLSVAASYPKPPPLPGESQGQPQPPPLPDASSVQEKPKPPPLPRSREASPPPLPPSSIPERKRTDSVSSTPSLDSVSSDPLSIDSEEEKPKVIPKTTPAKSSSPASSTKSTPGKASPGKVAPGKRRVILKKVVVRKADGTKVVRVVRMDPTKATAKRLLMRATSRAAGEQGGLPKGKIISPAKVKTEESKKPVEEEESTVKSSKLPEDDLSSDVTVSPLLGKRKHLPMASDARDPKVAEDHPHVAQVKEEPVSSEDDVKRTRRPERRKHRGFTREEIEAANAASSDSDDEEWTPSSMVPKEEEEDSLSKDLEDVSSSGSDMDFEEGTSSNYAPDRRDYFPVEASDSDSHVSDVTVSSVHTSDLSSFDDKISSSSSSSSSSEESEQEDTDDYGKKPVEVADQSEVDTKPISVLPASKGEVPERSVSPASSGGGKTSPRPADEARWKRQHMVGREDDETRAERRKRADTKVWIDQHHQAHGSKAKKAEAKEERAKRRQQMKEERERERESNTSPSQSETRKLRRGRSENEGAEGKPYTKQQLKEQKLQEKRRQAKRQRTLFSQSDDSPAGQDSKPRRKSQFVAPPILRHEFFLKKRRNSQIPFHHLLTLDMAYKQILKKSQQRAKYINLRAKEEKEGKKSYSRFNFQAPGKKSRKSSWQQASAERRKRTLGREEPSTSEAVQETVAIDKVDQQEIEEQFAHENDRLEMISPTSPDPAPQEAEKDGNGTSGDESIESPKPETKNEQYGKSIADKVKEPESERTDTVEEGNRLTHEKGDSEQISKLESPDDTVIDTIDVNSKENEAPRMSPTPENIPSTDTKTLASADSTPDSDQERWVSDEDMDVEKEETITQEEHHEEEDTKLETEDGELEKMDKEQESDREEKAQMSEMGDEQIAASVEEDTVPTFVVLEREEISSEEGDFDDADRVIAEEDDSAKGNSMKLPSIFQQTEAISSDEEELDDIIPSSSSQAKNDEDRVEERSEGEVDEDAAPLTDEKPVTKLTELTEDISGDELSDAHSLDNPPTPTMDEPSEFESLREESNDGQATIPIVLANSPKKGKGLGYSTGSSSGAEETRTRESTPKDDGEVEEKIEDINKKEDIEEGELAEIEEGEVPEEKEQASGRGSQYGMPSGQGDSREDASGYGKRPRRRTFSQQQGKDDDYLYFGLPKRMRRQSPTRAQSPTVPAQGAVQRKPLTRERSRSGGMTASQTKDSPASGTSSEQEERVPASLPERRSSRYSRRVSPPRRYSPSEQRSAPPKGKGQDVSTPPSAVSSSPSLHEPDQSSQPPQPHRHFTRRMSGRDEERRSHRYEDMYYYDNKKSRGNSNPPAASGKPVRRTSAEERKRKR